MTAFFMVSGYSMYLTYQEENLSHISNIKIFYIKRALNLFPLYYVVSVIYIVLCGTESLKENLILFPVELLGIQSVFTTLFPISHNDGTWFISCILFCYLIYPFLQEIVKQSNDNTKIKCCLVAIMIMLWSPIVVLKFDLSNIYSNPFFRMVEFFVGIILCSVREKLIYKKMYSKLTIFIEWVILISMVTFGIKLKFQVGNYMLYEWISLPLFGMILISMSKADFEKANNKVIQYLCKISYAFFLAQFFAFKITNKILMVLCKNSNLLKIIISFIVCLMLAVIFHETVEKNISIYLRRKILKSI